MLLVLLERRFCLCAEGKYIQATPGTSGGRRARLTCSSSTVAASGRASEALTIIVDRTMVIVYECAVVRVVVQSEFVCVRNGE